MILLVVLKKLKNIPERCSVRGFHYVCLLHNNAPAHTSEIVKQFLKSEKCAALAAPPYLVCDISRDKPLAQPVPERYTQISLMGHIPEVDSLTEVKYFQPQGIL